jgi:hypothetical protein
MAETTRRAALVAAGRLGDPRAGGGSKARPAVFAGDASGRAGKAVFTVRAFNHSDRVHCIADRRMRLSVSSGPENAG